jgi:RNase P subunit RPR2
MDLWREAMKDAKNKLKMLFEASDENGNGVMEMDEFMQMIESLKTDVSEREVLSCAPHHAISLCKFCAHILISLQVLKMFQEASGVNDSIGLNTFIDVMIAHSLLFRSRAAMQQD